MIRVTGAVRFRSRPETDAPPHAPRETGPGISSENFQFDRLTYRPTADTISADASQ